MNTLPRRLTAVGALAAAAVLATAAPALAHVTVDPKTAPGGGYATVDFKVPNERDDASTVKLEVTLPKEHPLSSAMPEPVPGWDVEVEEAKLDTPLEVHGKKIDEAPSKITWTATDSGIAPGTFQRFPVSLGRLPEDADRLVFKAIQTYDGGEVVRWIEVPEEGGEEPDSPAPVLSLTEGGGHGHHGENAEEIVGEDPDPVADTTAAGDDDTTDATARVLAVIGIVVGLGGVAFGLLAGRRHNA
ncbi:MULTISPECIES: YcnI family protein [unclassified Streptomyces]|uniref:YcnI family protein n=1 Tax=unclassified Streptomyces TaxID=2593676 RepID=UPI0022B62B1F|nr:MULTISPECIES: YcnI family protein [unclassified Streptomyces]MCZ7417597.1 YcnI family protein [Streptomyces sp. WMMC897]MCZ7432593.1 YcnI family protein [Streptomyces sp. WMMC1477]